MNVWRSIAGVVRRSPLALADASSIAERDLHATDQIFPGRVGEIYHVSHNPAQHWYYAPAMTQDEVLLIKGWDSDANRARFTPHAAFNLPNVAPDAPARESLEVRTYAIVPDARDGDELNDADDSINPTAPLSCRLQPCLAPRRRAGVDAPQPPALGESREGRCQSQMPRDWLG